MLTRRDRRERRAESGARRAERAEMLAKRSVDLFAIYLVYHRCHLYQGTDTSTIAAGHAMLTARRPSLLESLYSSSIATLMIISPVSVVSGPETARNPPMREPSSDSKSTCCPGSGTRGGLLLPNIISSPTISRVFRAKISQRPVIHHSQIFVVAWRWMLELS